MKILGLSASASTSSSNFYLLKAIQKLCTKKDEMQVLEGLQDFSLFSPARLEEGIPENIRNFKNEVLAADLIIISTPEYTHNIPAALKSILEWCTASGEFSEKAVLPISFTPKEPRGEYAMKSLLQSLQTMHAKIETQVPLYKSDVNIMDQKIELPKDVQEIIETAIGLYR